MSESERERERERRREGRAKNKQNLWPKHFEEETSLRTFSRVLTFSNEGDGLR